MTTIAEVKLWGNTIGAVSLEKDDDVASFQYDPAFIESGIELPSLNMPLAERVYRFPDLNYEAFYGLPDLLADSLPDKYGNALIDSWLAKQANLSPGMLLKIERGITSPSLNTLAAIANTLNVPVTSFFRKYEEQRDCTYVQSGQGLEIERHGI